MKTQTLTRVKSEEKVLLTNLQQEVALLRSAVIALLGEDQEGQYRPEFVAQTLKASQEPAVGRFKDAKSFLRLIQT
jgi:hypothetical protein